MIYLDLLSDSPFHFAQIVVAEKGLAVVRSLLSEVQMGSCAFHPSIQQDFRSEGEKACLSGLQRKALA
jgi:hypothetical protein